MNFKDNLCGMNSHYRFYTLEKFFCEMNRLGIKYVEIWTGPMHYYVDYQKYQSIDELKVLVEKYDVRIIGICPEQTNPKPNNIAASYRKEDILSYYKNMIDIADAVGAQHILVTSGWAYYDEIKQDAWKRSVNMMKKICEYARAKNILVAMEALQPDESILVNNVKDLKKYKEDVDDEQLKICIDFGAMARASNTIQDYFDAFKEDVIHIHFVDGKPTGHLAWSDGERDLVQDLADLEKNNYHGYLSLETATSRYYEKPWIAEETTIKAFEERKEVIQS